MRKRSKTIPVRQSILKEMKLKFIEIKPQW